MPEQGQCHKDATRPLFWRYTEYLLSTYASTVWLTDECSGMMSTGNKSTHHYTRCLLRKHHLVSLREEPRLPHLNSFSVNIGLWQERKVNDGLAQHRRDLVSAWDWFFFSIFLRTERKRICNNPTPPLAQHQRPNPICLANLSEQPQRNSERYLNLFWLDRDAQLCR